MLWQETCYQSESIVRWGFCLATKRPALNVPLLLNFVPPYHAPAVVIHHEAVGDSIHNEAGDSDEIAGDSDEDADNINDEIPELESD